MRNSQRQRVLNASSRDADPHVPLLFSPPTQEGTCHRCNNNRIIGPEPATLCVHTAPSGLPYETERAITIAYISDTYLTPGNAFLVREAGFSLQEIPVWYQHSQEPHLDLAFG